MAKRASTKVPVFIFLGRTGSGKSKIAETARKKIGLPSISIGKLARAEMAKGSALGKELGKFVVAGKPFPTQTAIELIGSRLLARPGRFAKGVILDNFPLTPRHIPQLEIMLAKHGMAINTVFHVQVPPSISKMRRAAAPRDAAGASAAEREKTFAEQTARAILYFKKKKLLRTLDATKAVSKNVARVGAAAKAAKRVRARAKARHKVR